MSVGYGIRPQTGRAYIKDLEAIGKLKIKNGKIKWAEEEHIKYEKNESVNKGNFRCQP